MSDFEDPDFFLDYDEAEFEDFGYPQHPRCYICAGAFPASCSDYELTINHKRVKDYSGFCADVDMDRRTYWRRASLLTFYRMSPASRSFSRDH